MEEKAFEIWLDSEVPYLIKEHKVPGVAVAVVRGDKVIYSGCWGVKCVDKESPITKQTLFEAASLTKPVFAYGVYGLIRDRVLELDRPLLGYLQEPTVKGDDGRLRKLQREWYCPIHQAFLIN